MGEYRITFRDRHGEEHTLPETYKTAEQANRAVRRFAESWRAPNGTVYHRAGNSYAQSPNGTVLEWWRQPLAPLV